MATNESGISNDYNVEVVRTEFLMPALPIQEHIMPLTNLDLTIPPVLVQVFFCYEKPSESNFSNVLSNLKNSLSKTLAHFYVLAGRFVTKSVGNPEILCNNKGAEFTEAVADTALAELEFCNPVGAVEGNLVPVLQKDSQGEGTPVFSVQVTEFCCGSIVVGCTFDHRIADSFSVNMFLNCWAKLSRNESIESLTPSFKRSTLVPRDPPTTCPGIDQMYMKHPSSQPGQNSPYSTVVSRIYHLNAEDIQKLQSSANQHGNSYTKLEAFSAYLWKLLIESEGIKDTVNCNIGIAVDGRSRLKKMGMSSNYFGNVVLVPFAVGAAGDIKKEPLSWSAERIHDAIHGAANEEHFQSLVDLIEMSKPSPVLPSAYCKAGEPIIVVSSGLRFPLYEVDHGWGKPTFASYYLPYGPGYVMPTLSPHGDGSWLVYMILTTDQLKAIEINSNFILSPITKNILAVGNM